jgi:hypothetical protein
MPRRPRCAARTRCCRTCRAHLPRTPGTHDCRTPFRRTDSARA